MKRRWGVAVLSMLVGMVGFAVMPQGNFWREVGAAFLFGVAYDLRLLSGAKSMFQAAAPGGDR